MNFNRNLKDLLLLLTPVSIFILFFTFPLIIKAYFYGFENFDLGIYGQALTRIAEGDLNPHLSVRMIHIFNDHFDPILIPFSVMTHFVRPDIAAIIIESIFLITAAYILYLLYKRKTISSSIALFGIVYILFNRGTISAINWPAHPTTWAVLPVILLGHSLMTRNFLYTFLSLNFLFTFREEFIFCGLILGVVFLFQKQNKKAFYILFTSLSWVSFVYFLRDDLLAGQTHAYGKDILTDFFNDPVNSIISSLTGRKVLQRNLAILFPIILILFYALRNANKPIYTLLLLTLPLLGIRLISGKWLNHYMAPVSAMYLMFIIHSFPMFKIPKKVLIVVFSLIFAMNIEDMIKTVKIDIFHTRHLSFSQKLERKRNIDLAIAQINAMKNKKYTIIANSNLIPPLVKHDYIYQYHGLYKPTNEIYDLLFFEIPPSGANWNFNYEELKTLISNARKNPNTKIIFDNDSVFLATGKFKIY